MLPNQKQAFTFDACGGKNGNGFDKELIDFLRKKKSSQYYLSVETITKTILKTIKPGAIVLMHFNHPEWNTYESLLKITPELRKRGYTVAKQKDYPFKGR